MVGTRPRISSTLSYSSIFSPSSMASRGATSGASVSRSAISAHLRQAPHDRGEEGLPVDAARDRVHDPLGMWHQPEHVAALVADTRDVVESAVRGAASPGARAVRLAVTQHDLPVAL